MIHTVVRSFGFAIIGEAEALYYAIANKTMDEYILVECSPTVEEYQRLHEAVGWENVDIEATEIGLRNSLFSVCVIYLTLPRIMHTTKQDYKKDC